MRYRLRTLLILLAIGPVVIYYVAMRRIESADTVEQRKDRQTRKTLESIRARMDVWLRAVRHTSPSNELILSRWNQLLTDDNGRQIRDAWGQPLTVGWRGWNRNMLYAKSNGINGIGDGFGDDIGDDIEAHFWLPTYGLERRGDSIEGGEPNP
jgi:hypothetical protein